MHPRHGLLGRGKEMSTTQSAQAAPAFTAERLQRRRKMTLSTLWIFATLNYLYCDVLGLTDHEQLRQYLTGTVNGLDMTPGFLLGAGILMEIPIAMVLLARVLRYRANRWANVVAGAIMTVVQVGTLFMGSVTVYYVFFSIVEIAATAFIVWYAWTWTDPYRSAER
jgi:Family of unknown function (DUF6326)